MDSILNGSNFRLTLHHHLLFLSYYYYYYYYYIGMSRGSESVHVHGGPILQLPTWLLCSVQFSYSSSHTHCHAFVCHCEDWLFICRIKALVLQKAGKTNSPLSTNFFAVINSFLLASKSELKLEFSFVRSRLSDFDIFLNFYNFYRRFVLVCS